MKMTVLWLPCAPECLMRPSRLRGSVQLRHVFLMWLTLPFLCYLLPYFSNILLLLFNVFMWKDLEDWLSMSLSHYFRILRQSGFCSDTWKSTSKYVFVVGFACYFKNQDIFFKNILTCRQCLRSWPERPSSGPGSQLTAPLPPPLCLPALCFSLSAHWSAFPSQRTLCCPGWVRVDFVMLPNQGAFISFHHLSLFIVTPLVTYIGGPPKHCELNQ